MSAKVLSYAIVFVILLFSLVAMIAGSMIDNRAYSSSPIAPVSFADPILLNLAQEKIVSVEVGQQSLIRISMHNNDDEEGTFVLIVEVRDYDDVTTYLSWQSGNIGPSGNYTMETVWVPSEGEVGSDYVIRCLAIDTFENPQILSEIHMTSGITVIESSHQTTPSPRHFKVTVIDETYPIEYTIDSGRIRSIAADAYSASMIISLQGVTRDGELSVTLPKELVALVFDEHMLIDGLTIFVNGRPVDSRQEIDTDSGSLELVIPLEQGAEGIEIVGTSTI